MGFLGVDLFFVISGFLVGGMLIKQVLANEPIAPGRFILSRGLKIWPSYYFFLFFGMGVAVLLYGRSHPGELIPLGELPRYLFFYRNYRGGSHPSFDHIWSLCVEEHFYILLPAAILLMQKIGWRKPAHLVCLFLFAVLAGNAGRLLGWKIHFETYSATHNRLDALAWGCLLWLGYYHYGMRISGKPRSLLLGSCILGLLAAMAMFKWGENAFFNQVLIYALVPVFFTAIVFSLLDLRLARLAPFRYLGYYSYNWYLWHPLFAVLFIESIPSVPIRAALYAAFTFMVGVIFTILVEEPVLGKRQKIIARTEEACRSFRAFVTKYPARLSFIVALFFYCAGSALLSRFQFGSYTINPDTTSYISLGKLYARGQIMEAVSSYWGPLSSMCIGGLIKLGFEPFRASGLLAQIAGAISIAALSVLSRRLRIRVGLQLPILLCASVALWFMKPIPTDALLVCLLLCYFASLFGEEYPHSRWSAASAGFFGGLAFLTKSYALPFFLLHFTLFHILHFLADPAAETKRSLLRNFALGAGIWAIICGAWIGTVATKTHRLTLGDSAAFTLNSLNPDVRLKNSTELISGMARLPLLTLGFLPPGPGGLSAWEAPILETEEFHSWSPFSSARNALHLLKLVFKNVYSVLIYYQIFSVFLIPTLMAAIVLCLRFWRETVRDKTLLYPLLTVLIFPSGYIFLLLEDRYLWINWILLLLMSGVLMTRLFQLPGFGAARKTVVCAFVFGAFVAYPAKEIAKRRNSHKSYYLSAQTLGACGIGGRIASSDNYFESMYFAFHLDGHYYGVPRPAETAADTEEDLKTLSIDHFILWNPESERQRFPFLEKFREVRIPNQEDLPGSFSVFSLHLPKDSTPCPSGSENPLLKSAPAG